MPNLFIAEACNYDISKRQAIINADMGVNEMVEWLVIRFARTVSDG